jgi:cell division protein ZapE
MPAPSVRDRYASLAKSGAIEWDPAQAEVAARLSGLAEALRTAPRGFFARLFHRHTPAEDLRGLYIWGDVGRGKTFLLDLFFEAAPVERKLRTHFHSFMTDVHARIFARRQEMKSGAIAAGDAVPVVADEIADEAALLCFDEFHVTDIADAMILRRLFERLFDRGVILVTTSNVEPDRLYEDGLNRALFLPFVDLLKERTETIRLKARTDFRLEKLGGRAVWHVPANVAAREHLDAAFQDLTRGAPAGPLTLKVQGRDVQVPRHAQGIGRARFEDLCKHPLGSADYLALANALHTLVLDGVPRLGPSRRDEARRFVHLIDALYESRVKLIASADAQPPHIWLDEEGHSPGYEELAISRTISRLMEMQSQAYLAEPHGYPGARRGADLGGIVET